MTTGLKANSDGSAAIQVGGTDVITLTSGGAATFVTSPTTLAGNLTFSGTGNRITGDFSNATVANRVFFQTSTVNGNTTIGVLPNGTATVTGVIAGNNSDPTNWSFVGMNALSSECRFSSGISGTGTYLPMTFYTGGTESMRLSATSKALILSGGDTSANGTGITFPATQSASTNANTLDDYEEGTFTPTATGASTAGTTTYTVQAGFYTKIGRQVTISIKLGYSAMTGTGTVNIGNLPFTSANTTSLETVGSVMTQNLNWTGGTYLSTYIDVNQAVLNVYGSTDDGALSAQQCVNETANYWIVHTYFTT